MNDGDPVSMRGVLLRGAGDAVLTEVPVPQPGPGEVVLRVDAALTCGTDAKVFHRGYHARMLKAPCLFGHEYSGTVHTVGKGVTVFAPGDGVVGANSSPCGACAYCEQGRPALCDELQFVNGAFAEYMLLPERLVRTNLYARPEGLDPVHAAATEPVACVLKGVDIADPCVDEQIAVIGSGPIALVFVAELCARGVPPVVFARSEEGAGTARALGARAVIRADSILDALEDVLATTPGGLGFDLVVEAAGAQETTQIAPELCRKGGRLMLFGGCSAAAEVTWRPALLHYDEISVLSSFHHTPQHIERALAAIASGRIPVAPLLESAVGLDDVPAALEAMVSRELRGKVPVLPGRVQPPKTREP